jgi:hypothetical protein
MAGIIIFILFILFNLLYNPNFNFGGSRMTETKVNNVNEVCIDNFCREFNKPTGVHFFINKIGKFNVIQIKRKKHG